MNPPPPIPSGEKHPVCAALAEVLRELREGRGWSRLELADSIKGSQEMIRKIEKAESVPTIDFAARICRAFGRPLGATVTEAEERHGISHAGILQRLFAGGGAWSRA